MSGEPVVRPHPEPVVLDIGADRGALVVHWTAAQLDTPIEISPTRDDDAREHQHILERPLPDATFYAAVFASIAEGTYTLWVGGRPMERDVAIVGGEVTERRWTDGSVPA